MHTKSYTWSVSVSSVQTLKRVIKSLFFPKHINEQPLSFQYNLYEH